MTQKKGNKTGIVKKTVVKPKKVSKSKKAKDVPDAPIAKIPLKQYTISILLAMNRNFSLLMVQIIN